MTPKQFEGSAKVAVEEYLSNPSAFDENCQLEVNPVTSFIGIINNSDYLAGIEQTEENGEISAAAEDQYTEESDDYQEQQDRDYYPIQAFIKAVNGKHVVNIDAIRAAAAKYE